MNRISYDAGRNRGELRLAIVSLLNFELGELTRQVNVHRRQIYDAVLVGNTTMRDIAFGINVQSVGVKPYKSSVELEHEAGERTGTALRSNAQAMGSGYSRKPTYTEDRSSAAMSGRMSLQACWP